VLLDYEEQAIHPLGQRLGGQVAFNVDDFLAQVCKVQAKHHFNPYVDVCAAHDRPDAPKLRQANLRAYLHALELLPIRAAWIGQDFGYMGGRRTGLPLTDERQLFSFEHLYQTTPLSKATRTEDAQERTASEVWKLLSMYSPPPLLWNVVPLHPHVPDEPMSNKPFSADAAKQSLPLLEMLLNHFSPQLVIAVGKPAEKALKRLGVTATYVRHPSHGGLTAFRAGIQKHMKI
jgi:uracil-DNA glycosylase